MKKNKKDYWEKVNDEICGCGHSKGYHVAHELDMHGGACEKEDCKCQIYTWDKFVHYYRYYSRN